MFWKNSKRRKKLKRGIYHNHSLNSSVVQDQKTTKRSPQDSGNIFLLQKPRKSQIAKTMSRKLFLEKFFKIISLNSLSRIMPKKNKKWPAVLAKRCGFCYKTKGGIYFCQKKVFEKNRIVLKKSSKGGPFGLPLLLQHKTFWLSARLEPAYPCF